MPRETELTNDVVGPIVANAIQQTAIDSVGSSRAPIGDYIPTAVDRVQQEIPAIDSSKFMSSAELKEFMKFMLQYQAMQRMQRS
jgi:hypothetical protein